MIIDTAPQSAQAAHTAGRPGQALSPSAGPAFTAPNSLIYASKRKSSPSLVAALASDRWRGCPPRIAILVGFADASRKLALKGEGEGDERREVSDDRPVLICRCRDGDPKYSAVVVKRDGQGFAVTEIPPPDDEITRRVTISPNIYRVWIKGKMRLIQAIL